MLLPAETPQQGDQAHADHQSPLPSIDALIGATRAEMDRILRDYAHDLPFSLVEIGKWALSEPTKVMAHLRGDIPQQPEHQPRWPLYVFLSYLAAADDEGKVSWQRAIPGAVAVEIAMAAADLLDEISDDDPSDIISRYGPAQALNTGNLMLVMAQQVLARHAVEGGESALHALLALQGMLVEAATGQHLDMLHSGSDVSQVSLETSAEITALKAGALMAGACRVGALLSGAPQEVVEAATAFGREVGAIAQIQNDIGDVLPEEMGGGSMIKRKTDIRLRKPTMPIIFTLRAEEDEPNALQQAYAEPPGTPLDEEQVRRAIVQAGGVHFGNVLMEVHLQNALAALEELERLRPGARELLTPLVPKEE